MAFNTTLIHLWILQEHARIEGKKRGDYSEIDLLIVEALQLATGLRLYSIAVSLRMFIWMALKAYRWPIRFLPRMDYLSRAVRSQRAAGVSEVDRNRGSRERTLRQDIPGFGCSKRYNKRDLGIGGAPAARNYNNRPAILTWSNRLIGPLAVFLVLSGAGIRFERSNT